MMEMNKCLIVIMLFVAVSQAERIDLTDAVVGATKLYNHGDLRRLVDGDENHNYDNRDCVKSENQGSEVKAYFQLDMLREVEVESVELLGRDDYDGGIELSYFEIHISKEVDADASNLCATENGEADNTQFNVYTCAQPMKGRYISITTINAYLTLCEIRVNGKLVNPDSFVDMSTAVVTIGSAASPQQLMVDGDLSQDFMGKCAVVGNDIDKVVWIQFDMGSVQTVGSVELLTTGGGPDQMEDYGIYVAEKDQTSPSNLCTKVESTPSLIEWNTYHCQNQMQGRYLTIRKKIVHAGYITVCELKVNSKGSLNDKAGVSGSSGDVEVSGSSGTCVRRKQCMAKTR